MGRGEAQGWAAPRAGRGPSDSGQRCMLAHCMCVCVCARAHAQLCPTACYPIDCSPPGSSVYGILQARVLEWVAIPFSRGFSRPRDGTRVACVYRQVLHC